MNLIGLWNLGAFLRDQSDSSYIAYVRQVARTNKNMNLLAEFSWIFSMKTAESLVQYKTQAITSAKCYTASLIQLFSCWRSRRILPTNSYSCLSLLLVSPKQCRMNLIGPSEMLQNVKDQSDSFYISYVRQVARTNKNIEFVGRIILVLQDENNWNTGAVWNPALVMTWRNHTTV